MKYEIWNMKWHSVYLCSATSDDQHKPWLCYIQQTKAGLYFCLQRKTRFSLERFLAQLQIPVSLQPDGVNLGYFKLRQFYLIF